VLRKVSEKDSSMIKTLALKSERSSSSENGWKTSKKGQEVEEREV